MSGWDVVLKILAALGGGGLIVLGLSSWLGRIWAQRILQNERHELDRALAEARHKSAELIATLEATLSRVTHANRVIFDHEFQVYRSTWEAAVDIRKAALSLRPQLDSVDPKESDQDRKTRRLKAYDESSRAFWSAYERNRPFYPAAIYQLVSDLAGRARKEAIGFAHGNPAKQAYWEESNRAQEEIIKMTDAVCEAFRGRISELSSVPSSGPKLDLHI